MNIHYVRQIRRQSNYILDTNCNRIKTTHAIRLILNKKNIEQWFDKLVNFENYKVYLKRNILKYKTIRF